MCYVVYMLLFEEAELFPLCIGLIPGAALLMISLVTSGGLGMGDVLMAFCLGPVFGASMMSAALFAGFFLCSISSLILLIFRKITLKGELAFLPFLTLGTGVICLVF